jgi:hypothetical protein
MEKVSGEKRPGQGAFFRRLTLPALLLVMFLALFAPQKSFAQCEPAGDAGVDVAAVAQTDISNLNLFIIQEESFAWNIMVTAYNDLSNYYIQFMKNIMAALQAWAQEGWFKSTQGMIMELHASVVDQSYRLGWLDDAQIMTEEQSRKGKITMDGIQRYAASELACDIDSVGPGLAKVYQISRALNRTLSLDDTPRRELATGNWPGINPAGQWALLPTTSHSGKGAEVNGTWTQFVAKFCDTTMGDQGCTAGAPPVDAGRERDIGVMLWGRKQTIDPTNQDNILSMQAALRYLIDPLAPDPIPEGVLQAGNAAANPQAVQGHSQMLERHAEDAFLNTIYNTMGAMLSERIGGSGVDVSQMRIAAGIPPQDQTDSILPGIGASYREINEAITRDRFDNPEYLVKLISDPVQVARERNVLSAMRLQTMNDIYRRQEELLFMESAEYSRDLNTQVPRSETGSMPLH